MQGKELPKELEYKLLKRKRNKMPIANTPNEYKKQSFEKLYKLYNIKDKADYDGSIIKYECTINGERGLFKERRSTLSKDHIMEQVVYELSKVIGVSCCFSSCRKAQGVYGSFSRFEVTDISKVIAYADILNRLEDNVVSIINNTMKLTRGNINTFVKQLYQYIIFDFIIGQQDRHLENLAVLRVDNRKIRWYPLYDNGFCLSACSSHDIAIEELNRGFYASRMGDSSDIEQAILDFRHIIFPDDLRNLIKYNKLNENIILNIIDRADKYNQMPNNRRIAITKFIIRQIKMIHNININNSLLEV